MRGFTFLLLLWCSFAHAEVCTLTLQKAEQIALQQNKDICALCQLYEAAKEGKYNAFSKWLPEVTLSSRGFKTEERQMATHTHSAFISQFELVQHIISTDTYYDLRISKLIVENVRLLLDALMIDVLYEVRAAYYRIILDYQNIETAKTNIEILGQLAERMEYDYRRGTSILLNVNQSKVAIANATTLYYQAIKDLEIDTDYLANLLGYIPGQVQFEFPSKEIPIGQIPLLSSKVQGVMKIFDDKQKQGLIYKPAFIKQEESTMNHLFTAAELSDFEMTALKLRPDLKSKCKEWKIAEEKVKKEKGTYWPELDFEFNYGGYPTYTQFDPSSSFFNQRLRWAVGFNVSWLLFDGCGRTYRTNQARFERNAKLCAWKKTVQISYEEVRAQVFSITESVANFVTAEGNVALAEQTLDLAKKQLEIGYLTIFDYQIVVDGLIQALYIRDRARFDLIKGYYGLIHATGEDLKGCM